MGYRKFRSEQLFTGRKMLTSAAVLILKDDGRVDSIVDLADGGDDIQLLEGMITPGFINTHCHIELSHMKGRIPERTGLVPFLTRVIRERHFPAEIISQAMEEAELELYNSGTVAIADICNTTDSIYLKESNRIHWRNFIEVIGFTETMAEERFAMSKKVLREFQINLGEGSRSSLSPHAPYSVSEALFSLINEESTGQMVTIHNQEAQAENSFYQDGSGDLANLYKNLNIDPSFFVPRGKTSLQTYLPWLNKAEGILLVHNNFSTIDDILFAQRQFPSNLYLSICINANRYIDNVVPPLDTFRHCNAPLTIGTDSYASNRHLNMLEEIKSVQHEYHYSIPLAEIMQWATWNGARALQMENQLGSFEPGKQPGVVWIDKVEDGVIARDAVARRMV